MRAEPDSSTSGATRSRWWWGLGLAGLLVALGVASVVVGSPEPEGQRLRGAAPPIELELLGGEGTVSLASFEDRPLVVNFFASWCVPCRNELPAFANVARSLEGQVAFLGVNHQDNRSGALDMLEEFAVPYPSGYDPDGGVAVDYGLRAMPSTVFVGPGGELLELHTGEMSRAQLEAAVERNFGVGPTAAPS